MHASDSASTDNDGYIRVVEEPMIYDTIGGEGLSRRPTDNLPPPPPRIIPAVSTICMGDPCDPYKKITIIPNNNEEKENEVRGRKWKKTHTLIGILVVLLVVVTSVALSVPIALHIHYTDKQDGNGNFIENLSTFSQSTTDSSTTEAPAFETTPAIETTSVMETTSETLATSVIETPSVTLTTSAIETTSSIKPTSSIETTSTTTSTIGPFPSRNRCHSCTCSSSRCPTNGQMPTSSVEEEELHKQYEDCDGPCFTEVRETDNYKTHRGCATTDWKWRDKDRKIGCSNSTAGSSFVCFCIGHYCNNHDMTKYATTNSCN